MKELPIPFRGDMVRAARAGHKTMTRRLVRLGKKFPADAIDHVTRFEYEKGLWYPCSNLSLRVKGIKCPYGQVGDVLWVREKFIYCEDQDQNPFFAYKAENEHRTDLKWRSWMFMPRTACRLTLQVTDVRVERLCDISSNDILAEGVECLPREGTISWALDCRYRFEKLWDSIHAGDGFGWSVNPWVWAISFKILSMR